MAVFVGLMLLAGCHFQIPNSIGYVAQCSRWDTADRQTNRIFIVSNRVPDCRDEKSQLQFANYRHTSLTYARADDVGPPHVTRYPGSAETARDAWLKDLGTRATKNRILVYVHGYLNHFSDELERAQTLADMQGTGIPVVIFSWASINHPTGYAVDENSALWAQEHFDQLLAELGDLGPQVTVVAHSMGNRIVLNGLRNPEFRKHPSRPGHIDRVVLAAADMDRDLAHAALRDISIEGRKVLAYASRRDRAIQLSTRLHGYALLGSTHCDRDIGYYRSRLGTDNCHRMRPLSGVAVVDTSEVSSGKFGGHRDFVASCAVAADLRRFLQGDEIVGRKASEFIPPRKPPPGMGDADLRTAQAADQSLVGWFIPKTAYNVGCNGAKTAPRASANPGQ